MSNSELVNYIKLSPNCNKPRNHKIDKITIHHMAGNLTVERCGDLFANSARQASANYGISSDGRVGLYVDECNRAWTSGSPENDNRAVTIEVANDEYGGNWHVSDKAIAKLIDLCTDICKRNGIQQLNFTGDASGNLTMHCYFQATACPGPYLKSKFPYIAEQVNARLGYVTPETAPSVIYAAYTDKWLPEVVNCNDVNGDGYAGYPGRNITGIKAALTRGNIVYRVHTIGGNYLDWVKNHDAAQGGYAGIYGRNIDGVQMYIDVPGYAVEYRVKLSSGDYLPWVRNYNDTTNGYAGIYGKPIDRIQIRIVRV